MQFLQSGPADRPFVTFNMLELLSSEGLSNCCNLLHLSHVLLLCPSSPDLCSSLCGLHLFFLLFLQIPSCPPLTQNKANMLRLGLTDMLALSLIVCLAFSAVSVSSSSCPSLFQPLIVSVIFLTLAETIHVPRSPSPHHLGSTLLYNGCSLAELLPPFFPLTSPPLTLSLSGRSALHWACSVNHLSLARTLIRYGAAVDLQDNKVSCDSRSIITEHIFY